MSETEVCDFGKLLKTLCKKLDFTRTVGIKKFAELTLNGQDTLLWRAGLVDENKEGMNICFHHEHLFWFFWSSAPPRDLLLGCAGLK